MGWPLFRRAPTPTPIAAPADAARVTFAITDLKRDVRRKLIAERHAALIGQLARDTAAGRIAPIPDRDIVVAHVRARRAAHQEQ